MRVIIVIEDVDTDESKVDISISERAPEIDEQTSMSVTVAWSMIFAAQKILNNSPVRFVQRNSRL